MARCYNCGTPGALLCTRKPCAAPNCLNKIKTGEGTDQNISLLCPHHLHLIQEKNALEQELRQANQTLRATLNLNERERADLAAQIRALESQLTEQEDIESKLKLVQTKLTQ